MLIIQGKPRSGLNLFTRITDDNTLILLNAF